MRTPWEVLEIRAGATPAEIVRAHRRLTVLLHPDRPDGGDAVAMAAVNAARDVLLAAARGWQEPSTSLARWRRPSPWDAALAPEPLRGTATDLAA